MSDDDRLQHIEKQLDELAHQVNRIENDLAKYRGMVGGVLLVVTAIITFAKLFWAYMLSHLK